MKISYDKLTQEQRDAICKRHARQGKNLEGCRKTCPFRFYSRRSSICLRDVEDVLKVDFKVIVPKEIL